MSVMLGGAAAGQEQQGGDQGQDSAAVSPKPHLDDVLSDLLECGLQLPPCLSARGNRTQAAGADVEPAAQQQAALSHAASGSIFSVADVDTAGADWECDMFLPLPPSASPRVSAVDACDAAQQEQQQLEQQPDSQQQQQQPGDKQQHQQQQGACMDAEVRSSMLEVLLQQFRWSSAASAAAAALPGNDTSGAGSLGEDGRTCGVCLDAVPTACILPCKHNMCGESH
jgi:hypothetical protein